MFLEDLVGNSNNLKELLLIAEDAFADFGMELQYLDVGCTLGDDQGRYKTETIKRALR